MSKGTPHKCPICGGRGQVLSTFYQFGSSSTGVAIVCCRACHGAGVLWDGEPQAQAPDITIAPTPTSGSVTVRGGSDLRGYRCSIG